MKIFSAFLIVCGLFRLAPGLFAQTIDENVYVIASPASGGTVTGGGTFEQGSTNTVTAVSDSGYTFSNWTEEGVVVSASPSYTFYVSNTTILEANFTPDFDYYTNSGAITITSYVGPSGGVDIPASINGLPVTAIASNAFEFKYAITSVVISNSITTIGASAFQGASNLSSISLGTGVTSIGASAFADCVSLTNIVLPSGLTSLGTGVFYECTNLISIYVASGNPDFSGVGGVLFNANQTTLLQYPGGLAGSYSISSTVTTVGPEAFWSGVRLTSIIIPTNVVSLGDGPFAGCTSLTSISVASQNPDYSSAGGVLFDKAQATLLAYPGGLAGSYSISNSVTHIGDYAFAFCEELTNVTVPASVTAIGQYAFEDCVNLVEVLFQGDAPTTLGASPFLSDTNATGYYYPGATGWGTFTALPMVLLGPTIQTTSGNFGIHSNAFGFTITGPAGIPIVVYASTNLASGGWTSVESCTLTNGSIYFSDPTWTNYPTGRFYTVTSP